MLLFCLEGLLIMTEGLTFIFSKVLDNPDSFFQGYCFQNSDYVLGEDGARSYHAEVGSLILPGQDGCYVSVVRKNADFEFSTDYSGNKKIFFFWSVDFWAVSNSLSLLVAHLRENNVRVSANHSQLRLIGVGGGSSVLNQLSSFSTAVEGVFLAPALCTLSIGKEGVSLRPLDLRGELPYGEALSKFCEVWMARFQVLLRHGVEINSDLTGGVDSRAVVSLVIAAAKRAGVSLDHVILRCGSVAGDPVDLDIATEIAAALGFRLNAKSAVRRRRLSGSESYAAWKALCLGIYHPIYFPRFSLGYGAVSFGGGGGENHRRFYKNHSFDDLVRRVTRKVPGEADSRKIEATMKAAMERIRTSARGDFDELIAHYRHFRNRLHAGRSPQHSVVFNPLGSKYLEDASTLGGAERIRLGQVSYDVMASMAPEVLDFRFDKAEKRLTPERREMLTLIKVADRPLAGRLYGNGVLEDQVAVSPGSGSPLDHLWEEVWQCQSSQVLRNFWGNSFVNAVVADVKKARDNGRFGHAVDGQNASALLASAMVL